MNVVESDTPHKVSGAQLLYGSPVSRAVAAASALNGGLTVTKLTAKQAAALFDLPLNDVRTIRGASPEAVEALAQGEISIDALRAAAAHAARQKRVNRYVERAGPPAVIEALCQLGMDADVLAIVLMAGLGEDVVYALLDLFTSVNSVTTD